MSLWFIGVNVGRELAIFAATVSTAPWVKNTVGRGGGGPMLTNLL